MSPRTRRAILATIAIFVGINAVLAGGMLTLSPSGGWIGLPLSLLEHSPFTSFLVPGLVLALVVGGASLGAGGAQLARRPLAGVVSMVAGGLLTGWLVVQMAMIREVNGLHAVMGALGLAQIGLAWDGMRRARAERAAAADARAFLLEKRIAIVGLSASDKEFSRMVAAEMAERGIEVVSVNRHARVIGGKPCYGKVSEIPDPPRAVLLMTPPEAATAVVADCAVAGVKKVWFHRGAGPGAGTGEAIAKARAAGMTVVSDACPLMYLGGGPGLHGMHRWLREGEGERAA